MSDLAVYCSWQIKLSFQVKDQQYCSNWYILSHTVQRVCIQVDNRLYISLTIYLNLNYHNQSYFYHLKLRIMIRHTYHLLIWNRIDQLWEISFLVWVEIQTCLWTAWNTWQLYPQYWSFWWYCYVKQLWVPFGQI